MRVAAVGATGFIGSHVVAHGREIGQDIAPIRAPRLFDVASDGVAADATSWRRANAGPFERLCRAFESFDVVINAAGVAAPRASDRRRLVAANSVLPAVVASAARAAGVRRLVHVSTAAVQGRRDPLDETLDHSPISPYADSKAAAESYLLGPAENQGDVPPEVVVYRPTSVHGSGRTPTRALARLLSVLPLVPVTRPGDRPVPVALIENVAAGIVYSATMVEPSPIVLQPWEGITCRRLLELFAARRIAWIDRRLADGVLDAMARPASRSPALSARLRWLELVVRGQGVRAESLCAAGFRLPAGPDRWEALAREQRRR